MTVNLIASAFTMLYVLIPSGGKPGSILNFGSSEIQYILYIGTNDKNTYEQIIPTEEAVEIVNAICTKYIGGYTMYHAKGGWVDEKDILTQENTLVYTIANADESDIIDIMNEILTALNQNSILVERRGISSVFYRGEIDKQ